MFFPNAAGSTSQDSEKSGYYLHFELGGPLFGRAGHNYLDPTAHMIYLCGHLNGLVGWHLSQ
jgi:hypothetical protein